MKKIVFGLCLILCVAAFALSGVSRIAAGYTEPPDPTITPTAIPPVVDLELAGGTWTNGKEVPMVHFEGSSAAWLQMLTNPVVMSSAGTTCHKFRGAQFGWIGEIRQLVDGKWVKVDATINQASPESVYTACVYAPKAGIYALFGYYSEE